MAARALAATAAQRTYTIMGRQPQWQNDTSAIWRSHLDDAWAYLDGDTERYYAMSRAVAEFLLSPLNHIEGQDGPDDFDRPQTIAAYCAVTAAVIGVGDVDNATQAVNQVFEALDLEHDTEQSAAWRQACEHEKQRVGAWLKLLLRHANPGAPVSGELIAALKAAA